MKDASEDGVAGSDPALVGEITAVLPLEPLSTFEGSLTNKVYLCLKDAILRLRLLPGTPISKPALCDQLGVSRAPVSEALARLSFDGLVDIVPQAGSFVSKFSRDEIREGVFLREALEVPAIERLATTITPDQLRALKRSLALQKLLADDGDFDGFYKADADMHRQMLGFVGFPRLVSMAESATHLIERARRRLLPTPGRASDTLEEHRAIIAALEAGDPKAAGEAARVHIRHLITKLDQFELTNGENA
ncbi:GntR family transcriptional regulator [Cucumibacter marinus]|uniref:GntR family transcriptional regulator n=1 Tax=Cucumibacter marinus TaxID=1121252 RepID=UPI001FDFD7B7|nr:GntR family transcriptional regulator [Cucumibacter marinus]